jgi:hypothetical protein
LFVETAESPRANDPVILAVLPNRPPTVPSTRLKVPFFIPVFIVFDLIKSTLCYIFNHNEKKKVPSPILSGLIKNA